MVGRTAYSMPLIMRSYCSSQGTLAKERARAICFSSFSVAAIVGEDLRRVVAVLFCRGGH